jgi:putative peptidoglycan lipid II flippase
MAPGAIGAGVTQINIVVGTVIASFLETGAIAYLYYADRVYQLPLGVIGIAVGTALLPLLARQLRASDDAGAMSSLNRAVELSMLFTLPAAAALLILPELIVEVLFQRGRFTAEASAATAGALMAFAAGLPAFVMTKILAPAYFAREDTTTPVVHAAFAMLLNIALSIALLPFLGHVGIALATSVAGWLNAGLLAYGLRRSPFFAIDARLKLRLPRIVLATAAMAAGLLAMQFLAAPNFASSGSERILLLVLAVAGGLVLYGAAVQLSGAATVGELARMLRRDRAPARDA